MKVRMSKRAFKNFKKNQAVKHADSVSPLPEKVVDTDPKGTLGGRCNVTACQREGSAIFLNLGMIYPSKYSGCYYCADCARDIHMANRDSYESLGMTLFPAFDEMMARRRSLRKEGLDIDDPANYADIDQNPWGSCYHSDRDKYEKRIAEQAA